MAYTVRKRGSRWRFGQYTPPGGGGSGPGAGVLLFDDFNYTVNPSLDGTSALFKDPNRSAASVGAWSYSKCQNSVDTQVNHGHIYTVGQIPGDARSIPGSGRALCLAPNISSGIRLVRDPDIYPDAWGDLQSDMYLHLDAPGGAFPADMWLQYWYYPRDVGYIAAANKLWYFSWTGFPAQDPFPYLPDHGYDSQATLHINENDGVNRIPTYRPGMSRPAGLDRQFLPVNLYAGPTGSISHPDVWNGRLGAGQTVNDVSGCPFNEWTLVRLRLKLTAPEAGMQMWLQPRGTASPVLVADWRSGVTPNFTWVPPTTTGPLVLRFIGQIGHWNDFTGMSFNQADPGSWDMTAWLPRWLTACQQASIPDPYGLIEGDPAKEAVRDQLATAYQVAGEYYFKDICIAPSVDDLPTYDASV